RAPSTSSASRLCLSPCPTRRSSALWVSAQGSRSRQPWAPSRLAVLPPAVGAARSGSTGRQNVGHYGPSDTDQTSDQNGDRDMNIASWYEAVEMYDEMLDDANGCASIAGLEYETSRVLKDIDPIAYREGLFAYVDSLEDENGEPLDSDAWSDTPNIP